MRGGYRADRPAQRRRLAQTAAAITSAGRRSIAIAADVTDAGALAVTVGRTEAELGTLTLAVNAAGTSNANPAQAMEEAQFQTMMDVNLKGVFLSCQAEARAVLAHGRGSIVNIASMSEVIVNRGLMQCHYNASKAGVIHMTKSMAMEWVGRGVRVNTISPGYTATPMNTGPEMVHQTRFFEEQTPMGRMAHGRRDGGSGGVPAFAGGQFCHRGRPAGRWRFLLLVMGRRTGI